MKSSYIIVFQYKKRHDYSHASAIFTVLITIKN